MSQPHTSAMIRPLRRADFGVLSELAQRIWREHYSSIISGEQIEYMLRGRFVTSNLQRYLDSQIRWFEVLEANGELVGYCSYARTDMPTEMKLEQLYLAPHLHGQGLGKLMLEHVERRSVELGCESLILQVNKRNDKAIQVYRRGGFAVREEVVVDIGEGFVMDDFIMTKDLRG